MTGRSLRIILGVAVTMTLIVALALGVGLVLRLDGTRAPMISTVMLLALAPHIALGIWLMVTVARRRSNTLRVHRWWTISIAVVFAAIVYSVLGELILSRGAVLVSGAALLALMLTGIELRAMAAGDAHPKGD
jgi:hypothetical protein